MSTLDFTLGRHEVNLHEPFITALRSVENYTVITYRVSDGQGVSGVGEAVATPAIIGDSIDQINHELSEIITPALVHIKDLEEALTILSLLKVAPSSKAAADMALHTYFAAKAGSSIFKLLGSQVDRIKTDVTIPISTDDGIEKIVRDRIEQGFTSLKVKLRAISLSENIAIMQRIEGLVESTISLRVDPNQAWDFHYAKDFLSALDKFDIAIDYLEQPVGKSYIDDLARLTELGLAPIMADESLFSMRDLEQIIDKKACTWVNVKILKSGGIAPARAIADVALASGLSVSIGSMMEGESGVKVAALLASAIAPEVTHDLDAAWWHRGSSIAYSNGEIVL